jgi:hypothetical protein
MPSGSSIGDPPPDEEFKFKKGANWQPENVKTLMQWIHISAIYIDILGESTNFYKRILRHHTIMNMVLSTIAGTISATSLNPSSSIEADLFIKILLTAMTFIIAISNGYLKIYNIHDKVEKNIRLQQQWIQFGSTLTSEMQLPVSLRKDALYFIIKMNDTYTQLFKQHIVANRHILKVVAKKNGVNHDVLTLSDLFERTIQAEALRIEDSIKVFTEKPITPKKSVLKMLRLSGSKPNLENVVVSPRQSISSYVLAPNSTNTEEERKSKLTPIHEDLEGHQPVSPIETTRVGETGYHDV